jgi:hypothetical protein
MDERSGKTINVTSHNQKGGQTIGEVNQVNDPASNAPQPSHQPWEGRGLPIAVQWLDLIVAVVSVFIGSVLAGPNH